MFGKNWEIHVCLFNELTLMSNDHDQKIVIMFVNKISLTSSGYTWSPHFCWIEIAMPGGRLPCPIIRGGSLTIVYCILNRGPIPKTLTGPVVKFADASNSTTKHSRKWLRTHTRIPIPRLEWQSIVRFALTSSSPLQCFWGCQQVVLAEKVCSALSISDYQRCLQSDYFIIGHDWTQFIHSSACRYPQQLAGLTFYLVITI